MIFGGYEYRKVDDRDGYAFYECKRKSEAKCRGKARRDLDANRVEETRGHACKDANGRFEEEETGGHSSDDGAEEEFAPRVKIVMSLNDGQEEIEVNV